MYEKTQERLFDIFVIIMYTTYILLLFGITIIDSKKLSTLSYFVNIYVGIILIYRFNRFRTNIVFTNLDRKIVFSAGLFMIISNSIIQLAIIYLTNIKNKIIYSIKNEYEDNNIFILIIYININIYIYNV